jgi:branched-subunit amino acid ABC-type transport system permease component
VLRPLVNQPQITLFMATIGLTFFIEGLAQGMWGASVRGLDLGIQDEPIEWRWTTGASASPSSTSSPPASRPCW